MNVLIISGSVRKNGNTELLLKNYAENLNKQGISTKVISLAHKKINHCLHCDGCTRQNKCNQQDDFNAIYEEVLNHQGLVIGSPVYVGCPSSLVLAFIQRLTYVAYNNQNPLKRKIGGPIVVAGEAGHLAALNCLTNFYLVNEMVMPSSCYWNIGCAVNKGDILKDNKALDYVAEFAKNTAWLMKKMKEEN